MAEELDNFGGVGFADADDGFAVGVEDGVGGETILECECLIAVDAVEVEGCRVFDFDVIEDAAFGIFVPSVRVKIFVAEFLQFVGGRQSPSVGDGT